MRLAAETGKMMHIIEESRTICSNPDSVFGYFAWPSVLRLPDGTLAAACSGFRLSHVCPFGKAVIFFSRDEGKSWSRPCPVIDTPLDDRDAGLCVAGNRLILTSFNNTPEFQRGHADSLAARHGESATTRLIRACADAVPDGAADKYLGSTYRISRDGGVTWDDGVYRSPVSSPHGPICAPDGRVIWIGRRYDSSSGTGVPGGAILCTELRENEGFVPISAIDDCNDEYGPLYSCEPHSVFLPDGRLLTTIRAQRGGERREFTVYLSVSSDGGLTHTPPRPILPHLAGSPPHLLMLSSGELVLTYGRRESPYGIRAAVSRDGGGSWDNELTLTDGAQSSDLGYPASVELSDGRILTLFYEREDTFAVIKQLIWTL